LPPLGQARLLPANDLAGFFDHADPVVRAAALRSLPVGRALPEEVVAAILPRLEDPAVEVRAAAAEAVASQKIVDAVPRLLTLANAEATRVEATRALAAIPDPRALPIYLAALRDRDPGPRKSAEQALLTLGDSVRGDLESLVKKGRLSGPAALAVERILARPRTVLDWRVIGPFPRAASPRFGELDAIDFAREQPGIDGRPLRWEVRKGDPATGRVVLDDFKAGQGDRGGFGFDSGNSPDLMAYAYAEIPSDRDGPALLLVGSSGSIVLVLNGKTVLNLNTAGRAFASDSDVVRVTLKQGVNRILVASRQGVGPWSFAVQVADASVAGPSPVETLRGFASSHAGDPKRGEELFFAAAGVGCAKCHAVGSRGDATVGPNLAGLASKYDKAEVIRSVLEPSSRIATGYQPVLIARQDGTILTGLIRGETETSVDLVDAQGKVVSILKTEIAERRLGETSLMPAGQADALTPVEFADLIAYLMSLSAR
jgi:putative heme-binding domain-containing protein